MLPVEDHICDGKVAVGATEPLPPSFGGTRLLQAYDGLKNRDALKNKLRDFVSFLDDEVIVRMVKDYNLDLSGVVGVNDAGTDVNHVLGSKARAGGYSSVDSLGNSDGQASPDGGFVACGNCVIMGRLKIQTNTFRSPAVRDSDPFPKRMDVERMGVSFPCSAVVGLGDRDRNRRSLSPPFVPGFDDHLAHLLRVEGSERSEGPLNPGVREPLFMMTRSAPECGGEVGRIRGDSPLLPDGRPVLVLHSEVASVNIDSENLRIVKKPFHEGLRPSKAMTWPFIGNSPTTLPHFTRNSNEGREHDLGLSSSVVKFSGEFGSVLRKVDILPSTPRSTGNRRPKIAFRILPNDLNQPPNVLALEDIKRVLVHANSISTRFEHRGGERGVGFACKFN